jgi:tRNA modification GTPase
MKNDLNDTIAAVATAFGEAGIGIVRLSGKDALAIADKIFLSKDKKLPTEFKTHTVHYGWVVDGRRSTDNSPQSCGIVDEALLTIMRKPKSYTREDVVEINCHGGLVALRSVLDLALDNGARLASGGEFTKRAFLNGRIDLSQAEAVLDVIRAKTDAALKIGQEQLRGFLSEKLRLLKEELTNILALLEARIDFPDEEIGAADMVNMRLELTEILSRIGSLIDGAKYGRVLREGLTAVICGRPNVGKSSLLNALLKKERSIVTPVAGTTRDVIEDIIDIKGIPVRIMDTAGLLEPRDLVEKKAVKRAKECIAQADIVIIMFDANKRLSAEDFVLMRRLRQKKTIAVINKIDLKCQIDKQEIRSHFKCVIELSAKRLVNLNKLEDAVADMVFQGRVVLAEALFVANIRHIQELKKAQKFIASAVNSLDNNLSIEFVAQDIRETVAALDEILGKRFSGDLLDKIFSRFCIGK